jgi:oligosaccharide repeat unit polymerase
LAELDPLRDRSSSIPAHIWPLVLAGVALMFLATADNRTLFVTGPLTVGLCLVVSFLWVLWRRRHGAIPWFEIGAVYVAVVTLYMAYPLVGFLALGQSYTPLNDGRLYMMHPGAEAIGRIGWLYVCHLGSFAAIYLLVRGRLPRGAIVLQQPRLSVVIAILGVYLAIQGFDTFLGLFYDMSSDSYLGTYLVARRLPLVLAQFANHLNGIKYVLTLLLLAALFTRYPRSKAIIVGWIAVMAVITITKLGSRTELVLLILSAAIMYDTLVRAIRPSFLLAVGVVGLAGFIAFGALRNGARFTEDGVLRNPFSYSNEFETLFANAVHLDSVRPSIGVLPVPFYLADFAALVPQQFAPFTKVDRGDWYVNRFFPEYAAMGGGLAFGTISESILTGDWLAALAAGAALGLCFALLHRFYTRRAGSFWTFVLYVWVTTLSYQSFRNSTFHLLVLFAYRFVPAVLFVNLLALALRPTMFRTRPALRGGALEA